MKYNVFSAEFTRPANATPYSIGDAVGDGTILTFASVLPFKGECGRVLAAWLRKSTVAVASANFRLHLFNATVTVPADNAALTIAWADRAKYQGQLTFANPLAHAGLVSSVGETIDSVAGVAVPLVFKLAADAKTLYGVLEAAAAYTPGTSEQFQIVISVEESEEEW